ncbi:MAG: GxxExxY protein [Caldilineaceae bacterium]|nr:GxxExxY protein [Caldilineaceae bacterium]
MELVEKTGLLLEDETYAVTGAAIEVHRALGPGFLEKVYQEAMRLELSARSIPFEAEKLLGIKFKGHQLTQRYFADLVCYEQIIVEIKALNSLSGKEEAQLLNYLKATGLRVGLLFNFGSHGKLERKRLVKEHR